MLVAGTSSLIWGEGVADRIVPDAHHTQSHNFSGDRTVLRDPIARAQLLVIDGYKQEGLDPLRVCSSSGVLPGFKRRTIELRLGLRLH